MLDARLRCIERFVGEWEGTYECGWSRFSNVWRCRVLVVCKWSGCGVDANVNRF